MAYIVVGTCMLLQGLLLLLVDSADQLRGVKMFIDFREHRELAGVLFLAAAFFLLHRGFRGPK